MLINRFLNTQVGKKKAKNYTGRSKKICTHAGHEPKLASTAQSEGPLDIKFAGENVNGMREKAKRDAILIGMKMKGQVIFLQETHTVLTDEPSYRQASKDTYMFAHGESNSRGVMIIISAKLEHEIHREYSDTSGRYIIALCSIQGFKFVLVNAYAPNKENEHANFLDELYEKIGDTIDGEQFDFFVTEADWNFTENIHLDRKGGNPKT